MDIDRLTRSISFLQPVPVTLDGLQRQTNALNDALNQDTSFMDTSDKEISITYQNIFDVISPLHVKALSTSCQIVNTLMNWNYNNYMQRDKFERREISSTKLVSDYTNAIIDLKGFSRCLKSIRMY